MKIEGVFFDLDGTLADTKSVLFRSYIHFMESYNLPSSIDEFNSLSGTPIKASIVELCNRYQLNVDRDATANKYVSSVEIEYLNSPLVPGASLLIEFLRSKAVTIALVTSATRDLVRGWINNNSLGGSFNAIITSDDVTKTKPDPEPYLTALNQLGISGFDSLAVEDSEIGVTSAIASGIFTIGLGPTHLKKFGEQDFLAVSDLYEAKKVIENYLDF